VHGREVQYAGAPRMTRAGAAATLDADLAQLERALTGAQDTRRTGSVPRDDPAAAALSVPTDSRRVSVTRQGLRSDRSNRLTELTRHSGRTRQGAAFLQMTTVVARMSATYVIGSTTVTVIFIAPRWFGPSGSSPSSNHRLSGYGSGLEHRRPLRAGRRAATRLSDGNRMGTSVPSRPVPSCPARSRLTSTDAH
jgi:hypothetical protein